MSQTLPTPDAIRRRGDRHTLVAWLLAAAAIACLPGAVAAAASPPATAFPGAQGWAASTPGGRGGRILRVTTLAASGPGSFAEAVNTPGPRIVVFEVGGVIDLQRQEVKITEPFLTIAGQTAQQPGITLIRGGLIVATNDVVIRHLRVRPGSTGLARRAGVDFDAITTIRGARDVIVDHCSLSWATDENLSASSTRFAGETPEDWLANASRRITFSNNILAEGLADSTHAKGEHSKGSLIHDHVNDVLIVGNLYAHNYERNPLFKGGARGQVINNLIYDPGQRAVHYNLIAEEWLGHAPYQSGQVVMRGNVLRAGRDTEPTAFFMVGGSGDVEVFAEDNLAVDRLGNPLPQRGRYTTTPVQVADIPAPPLPFAVALLPSAQVQDSVIANAGARPWDRDDIDRRIVADTIEGRGGIIDSEDEVGGYPQHPQTRQAFVAGDWDLDTMEPRKPLPRREPLR